MSTGAKEKGITAGIAVGSVIGLEALFAGPISGASMNAARSFAPALVSFHFEYVWVYLIAPVIGALLAVPCAAECSGRDAVPQEKSTCVSMNNERCRVLFVCIENAGRSQMAEGFAKMHGGDRIEAYSAGSRHSGRKRPAQTVLLPRSDLFRSFIQQVRFLL